MYSEIYSFILETQFREAFGINEIGIHSRMATEFSKWTQSLKSFRVPFRGDAVRVCPILSRYYHDFSRKPEKHARVEERRCMFYGASRIIVEGNATPQFHSAALTGKRANYQRDCG